jgi:hypothetical protein
LNNKSKINTSKGKMYLTVVAFASLLMMSFNLQTNMNSNMQAYASIFENIQNVDDIGQSLECVIVVVGCDGQGSVGSSGDVNIGVGDNDTTTDGETPIDPETPFDPNTLLPPGNSLDCSECIEDLPPAVLVQLQAAIDDPEATAVDICAALTDLATVGAVIAALDGEVSVDVIVEVLACLGVEITVGQVQGIIDGL